MAKVAIRRAYYVLGNPVHLRTTSPQASGLVGWWPTTDYASGNLLDRSGNDNHGTLNGSVVTTSNGTMGTMLRFEAQAGSYFSVPSATAINPTGSLSISFWMYPRWPAYQTLYGILGKGTEYPRSLAQYLFYHVDTYESQHCIDWQVGIGDDTFVVAEGKPFSTNTLYHVVGVHDAATPAMRTYQNGALDETWTGTTSTLAVSSDPLEIGRTKTGGTVYAYCDLADIRIYNKALSLSEIQAIYDDPWDLYR